MVNFTQAKATQGTDRIQDTEIKSKNIDL